MIELTNDIALGTAQVGGGGSSDVEENTATNKTGSEVANGDKVWVNGSNLISFYDMSSGNFTLTGTPTITNGVASGFSTSNYIQPNCMFDNAYNSDSVWEWKTKFNLETMSVFNSILGGSSGSYLPDLYVGTTNKIGTSLSSNGTSYDIGEYVIGTTDIQAQKDYWVKWGWTGTVYYIDLSTDGVNYSREVSINSTSPLYSSSANKIQIGFRVGQYLHGTIDLKETSFALQNTTQGKDYVWRGYDILANESTITGVAKEAIANNASGKVLVLATE